jgi:hypothetical protein
MMSDAAWYYAVGSEQRGPVSTDDIALLIGRGEIGPDTLMWREGHERMGRGTGEPTRIDGAAKLG